MSYSRWRDERFWPLFRDALQHPSLTEAVLAKAREFQLLALLFPRHRTIRAGSGV
jgi:hypothetical protein